MEGLTPEEIVAHLAPAERVAGLAPAERVADLTTEERVLLLTDDQLRALPDSFLASLSPDVQARVHARRG
jgi:hypothetical protein